MKKLNLLLIASSLFVLTPVFAIEKNWKDSYAFEAKGEYNNAIDVIAPLLEIKKNNDFAWVRYGWLNYLQGNYNTAKNAYKNALKLNSVSLDAMLGVVNPLQAQKRWKEANYYINKALKEAPWNLQAHLLLMVEQQRQQNWGKLKTHAKEVNSHYPSNADALVYLARAHAWLKEKDQAKEAYSQVLTIIPAHIEASNYLAK